MNETKKTGIFWGAAAIMALIATFVSWPAAEREDDKGIPVDTNLFAEFKDPLLAASMKIVTFDEEQGQLGQFEVRKDPESGNWTIPSREGYPADAVDQMMNAANALVDLKVLDKRTANAEEHAGYGVVEPKLEELNIGDEGVGRLVTFKDESQKVLASLVIGDPVKDQPGQIYVRKPGQDLVYVVPLDDAPLTTKFQEWIEDDLLKLSSIDIDQMQVKDYSASLGQGGITLARNYEADFEKEGSQWSLKELREFDSKDPRAGPTKVEVPADKKLNTSKLGTVQSALDDLKIVNVIRKPDGMSANLRANKDFLADQKAINSLATRGFYPVPIGEAGETEILSANGELTVGLKDGVEYVLRFGNIAGTSEEEGEETEEGKPKSKGGVNRYLLVTTRVNNDRFPAPQLTPVPQTLEELEAMNKPEESTLNPSEPPKSDTDAATPDSEPAKPVDEKSPDAEEKKPETSDKTDAEEKPTEEKPAEKKPAEEKPADAPKSDDAPATDDDGDAVETKSEESGETESEGSGEASGTGQAQEPASDDDVEAKAEAEDAVEAVKDDKQPAAEKPAEAATSEEAVDEKATDATTATEAKPVDKKAADEKAGVKKAADKKAGDKKPADKKPADKKPADEPTVVEETDEEKQERLEAAQEKITKENQRLMDERKDRIEKATRRVRELNARFADWYYVIPEDTYGKLTIKRDDLFEKPGTAEQNPGAGGPQFNFGAPGGFPPGN